MSNDFLEELTALVRKHINPSEAQSIHEVISGLEIAKASVLSRLIEMAQNAPSSCGDAPKTASDSQTVAE